MTVFGGRVVTLVEGLGYDSLGRGRGRGFGTRSVALGLQRRGLHSLLLLAVRPLVAAEGGGVQEHLPAGEAGVGFVVASRGGAQVALQVRLQVSRQGRGVAEAPPALGAAVSPPPGPPRGRSRALVL